MKGYLGNFIKKRRLHREMLSSRFWKNYEHDFEHLCETASEIMSKKEFVI